MPRSQSKIRKRNRRVALAQNLASKIGYLDIDRLLPGFLDSKRVNGVTTVTLESDEMVYPRPDNGPALFVLSRGSVDIFHPHGRHRSFVMRLGAGAVFGELPALQLRMYGTEARTSSQSQVLVLTPEQAMDLLLPTREMALRWMEITAAILRQSETEMMLARFGPFESRLAWLLTQLADGMQEVVGITQEEIAKRLGVHRGSVCYALRDMKRAKLVKVGRSRIKIVDPERLRKLATF